MPRTTPALTFLRRFAVAITLLSVILGLALGWVVGGLRMSSLMLAGTIVLYGVLLMLVLSAVRTLTDEQTAIQEAFDGAIQSLAAAIDTKDAYSTGHTVRLSLYAQAIARALLLPADDVQIVRLASYLRNLGKIGIPDQLLQKSGPLDEQEWATVRRQALIVDRILESVPIDERVKLAVRHSHERWDGSGYPDGLAGEAIPIHARILLVAESYVAMCSERPYRRAKGPAEAIGELRGGAGGQFDPRIVEVFLAVLEQEDRKAWVLGPLAGRTATGA